MAKGIIKIYNHQRGNGYIERPDGTLIEFQVAHSRDLKPQAIELGAVVEFDLGKMPKGELVATNVKIVASPTPEPTRQPRPREQRADHPAPGLPQRDARAERPREQHAIRQPAPTPPRQSQPAAAPSQADVAPQFLNPYNFVRYLERADDPNDSREVKLLGRCAPPPHDRWVGLSGKIVCDAKVVTPLFVADAEEITGGEHKTYRFFKFNGAPAIPASSLRGMTRAVFEAVTNSCYAVFDESPLSQHLEAKRAPWLVPARVLKVGDAWKLQLLTGATPLQIEDPVKKSPEGDQYAGWLASYWPLEPSKTLRDLDSRRGPAPTAEQKAKRLAFIKRTQNRGGINPEGVTHGAECYALIRHFKHPHPKVRFWNVVEVRKKRVDLPKDGSLGADEKVVSGWLCLTNQNIEAKHSERFFFRDKDKAKGRETIDLPEPARTAYEKLIADYQDRHAKDVRKRVKCSEPEGDKPAFSRFVCEHTERKLVGGELVYAMLDGTVDDPRIEFIAPVSVPRLWYKKSRGDLLKPEALHHCTNRQALCPACRTFGWVRGERDEEGAYASRVRFSHAMIAKANPIAPMTLAILGEPKPTTTRFYLVGPDGKPSKGRDDQTSGYDGNNGKNRLRGRKFYRHHSVNNHSTAEEATDQNRTIADPQGEGAEFSFTVDFENLAPVELGALLWSLEIGGAGYHRLGYGKPLGLGSVEVKVRAVTLRDHAKRYASLSESGDVPETNWKTYVDDFKKFAAKRWEVATFADLAPAQDLLAIVNRADPTLPVHYPCSPASDSQGAFEWFVGNKSKRGPKVELALAAEDKGLPLIDKKGNQYATGDCAK